MEKTTIKLFLIHGSPDGLRTAELSNWSGKAVSAPRNELSVLLKRKELSNPGFYFLTGVDPESGEKAMYIGEAEDVANRLKNHSEKDFWNSVTVFVSKDQNLTKAHIRYIEGKLISIASENITYKLMNSVSSGARLPESDKAEMDVFLQKTLQLLPVLGVIDFSKVRATETKKEDLLFCKIKGLIATGKRTAGGFTVYSGSQAVREHLSSAIHTKKKREQLVKKSILVAEENCLLFSKDVEFSSPSAAAAVVRGGSANGLTSWKNGKGNTLREIDGNEI